MITKTISGELFLFSDNSNRDLVFCFAMFCFSQVLERAACLQNYLWDWDIMGE